MNNRANSDNSGQLSIKQKNCIDVLIQGVTDKEAAEKVGVRRQTVTSWRNKNPHFQAELNRRRHEVWGTAEEKLRNLLSEAISVLEDELRAGNRLRAAKIILKASGLYGNVGEPRGFSNAETIVEEKERQKKLRELEL